MVLRTCRVLDERRSSNSFFYQYLHELARHIVPPRNVPVFHGCIYKMEFFYTGYKPDVLSAEDAIPFYQQLLDLILSGNPNNGYNEAECHLKLGLCYFELGDYQEAIQHFDAVLYRKVDTKIAKRLDEHYRDARAHRKKSIQAIKK